MCIWFQNTSINKILNAICCLLKAYKIENKKKIYISFFFLVNLFLSVFFFISAIKVFFCFYHYINKFLPLACMHGYYKENCAKTRGNCLNNEPCDNINGTCTYECKEGFKGDLCTTGTIQLKQRFHITLCQTQIKEYSFFQQMPLC